MIKCSKCGKSVSELDEKCKYCGVDFERFEQTNFQEKDEDTSEGYVTGYNVFICILGILIFVGGIIIGQEEINVMFISWISGGIFLVIINMLKNIIEELRILNSSMNKNLKK